MGEILALPVGEFIRKFSYLRKPHSSSETDKLLYLLDRSARADIVSTLTAMRPAVQSGMTDENEIIRNILGTSTCRQSSKPGAVHIASVNQGLISLRKNIFLCGMNASMFPGIPRENYLLLDSELEDFGASGLKYVSDGKDFTSYRKIQRKQEDLMDNWGRGRRNDLPYRYPVNIL